jgi:hypothetical protein
MTTPDPYEALRPAAPQGQEQDAPPPPPQYTPAQADQAVQEVQHDYGSSAGESLGKMDLSRAAPQLPAESVMDQLMAEFKKLSEQVVAMQGQLDSTQRDAAAARAFAGPPPLTTYADNVAALLEGHRNANPDLPKGHFDQAVSDARDLANAAHGLADGEGSPDDVHGLAGRLERFLTVGHRRRAGKALDFSAILDALEWVRDEAEKAGSGDAKAA